MIVVTFDDDREPVNLFAPISRGPLRIDRGAFPAEVVRTRGSMGWAVHWPELRAKTVRVPEVPYGQDGAYRVVPLSRQTIAAWEWRCCKEAALRLGGRKAAWGDVEYVRPYTDFNGDD